MPHACECRIVGGGVAGAALAFLLARDGIAVTLHESRPAARSGPVETLLPPARVLLERTGLAAFVLPAAERDPLRHGAIWGSDELVWRDDAEPGWLLHRGRFDAALRAAAAAAGAQLADTAPPAADPAGVRRAIATGRGSAGPWRQAPDDPPRSVAFVCAGTAPAGDRGTAVVEAVPDGWTWTHVLPDGNATAAVIVDADDVRGADRDALLARCFAASRGPAGRLAGRVLVATTDASSRLHAAAVGELRLGDAAATIDPLASQGVEKALAGADHAAAVVRTARQQPGWWERLCDVQQRWEAQLVHAHRDVAAAWYRREPRFRDAPFWRRRATAERTGPDPATAWTVAATVMPARMLVREGPVFVERDGFVDRRSGDERSHVGYVPVAPLLALFAQPRPLAAAVPLAGRDARLFVLPPRAVHGALVELVRSGWLSAAPPAAGTR